MRDRKAKQYRLSRLEKNEKSKKQKSSSSLRTKEIRNSPDVSGEAYWFASETVRIDRYPVIRRVYYTRTRIALWEKV